MVIGHTPMTLLEHRPLHQFAFLNQCLVVRQMLHYQTLCSAREPDNVN